MRASVRISAVSLHPHLPFPLIPPLYSFPMMIIGPSVMESSEDRSLLMQNHTEMLKRREGHQIIRNWPYKFSRSDSENSLKQKLGAEASEGPISTPSGIVKKRHGMECITIPPPFPFP